MKKGFLFNYPVFLNQEQRKEIEEKLIKETLTEELTVNFELTQSDENYIIVKTKNPDFIKYNERVRREFLFDYMECLCSLINNLTGYAVTFTLG